MASVFYRCKRICHQVFQPESIPETHYPRPHSTQIELTVAVDLLIHHHDCLNDCFTGFSTSFSQEILRFDLNLLQNHGRAYDILGPVLRRLKIHPESLAFHNIVNDIIFHGFRMGNLPSNRGRKVLPLRAEIWMLFEEHSNNERVLMRRAVEESALAANYGMVPAEESSVKKMLKRVRPEDDKKGEDCVICLEQMKVGSDASEMPCSHTFHGDCIEQWLKQSHYCPICRFEMPISES